VTATSRRERRSPWRAAFFGLAVTGLAGGIAWALLGSSFFVVRSVRVTGAGAVPRSAVLAAAGIAIGTPLLRVDVGAAARRVEQITLVQSASVARSWPDAVVISVIPRTAVLAVRAGHGYDRVDRFGVVLDWTPGRPLGLPLLARPAGRLVPLRDDPAVRAAGTIVHGLPRWLRRRLTAVRAPRAAGITLILRGGVIVAWGGTARTAAKASELAILLRDGAPYYDVSDPVTAVTGPTPTPSPAPTGRATRRNRS
jgi:cell division protein FtsQ